MKEIYVTGRINVEILPEELFRNLRNIAETVKNEQWVIERNGKKIIREEVYTSHRFDINSTDQSSETIEKIEAADNLLDALKRFEVAIAATKK